MCKSSGSQFSPPNESRIYTYIRVRGVFSTKRDDKSIVEKYGGLGGEKWREWGACGRWEEMSHADDNSCSSGHEIGSIWAHFPFFNSRHPIEKKACGCRGKRAGTNEERGG